MADIQIDTTAVSVTTFQIAGVSGNFDGAHGVTVSLDAGDYQFEQVLGSPFSFTVTSSGTVEFDPKYSGFLAGNGTTTLTVTGYPITIDGRTLPHDLGAAYWYVGPDGTSYSLSRYQTHQVNILPMLDDDTYRFMSPNGDFTAAAFNVSLDGHLVIKPEYAQTFAGDGTTTLTVTGFPITIDGRAVPYDLRGAYWYVGPDGTNGLSRDQTHVVAMLPMLDAEYYRFMDPAGATFTAAAFNVSLDGHLVIKPEYAQTFAGDGTTTLTVTGFPITIDGRAVPYDLRGAYWYVGPDGTNGLSRDQTHVVAMLPMLDAEYYRFMDPAGATFTAAAFNVSLDGHLVIKPEYAQTFAGDGTTTLTVTGFPITIDGRAVPYDLRGAYWYVGPDGTNGLSRDQTHVVAMLPMLDAEYYRFMDPAGATFTAAAFNVSLDGHLVIKPEYAQTFAGDGTTTLTVTGFPITIDGRAVPYDLRGAYWYVGPDGTNGLSRDQTHVVAMLPMLDAEYYRFMDPAGATFTAAAFNVSLDGHLVIKPEYAQTFAGDGTTTLTVTGFPITIDGRAVPYDLRGAYWYVGPDGTNGLSRDQTHVVAMLPMLDAEYYRFMDPAGATFTAAAFNVSLDGHLVIKPEYAQTFAGDGTTTLTVTGFPITIDGRAVPYDLSLDGFGGLIPTLTRDTVHSVDLLPLMPQGPYSLSAQPQPGPSYRFVVNDDGTVTQLDPSPPWIYGTPRVTPPQLRSRVSELRRAVEQAEVEFNRYDTLVSFSAVGDRFTTERVTALMRLNAARKALAEAVSKEPPIWTDGHPVPTILVPVRLETRYRPNAQHPGADTALAIRVIPDDIAVHTFEPELTETEYEAAVDYWTSTSTTAATDDDKAAAWTGVLKLLGPARAAWAVEATFPTFAPDGTPQFPDTPRKAKAWTRAASSLLLPDRFVFRGWRGRRLVFELVGAAIPDDLAIGPDPDDLNGPVPALGWSAASAWMVDFDEAVRVGMGVLVPLTGPDVAFDELTVVGISSRGTDESAARMARSLQGQLYTRGLAFPRYGTPTNNTPATRSQWSSAPAMRTPSEVAAAVAAGKPGSGQPAILLAEAMGFDPAAIPALAGRRDLLAAEGGTVRDDEAAFQDSTKLIGLPIFTTSTPAPQPNASPPAKRTGWLTTQAALDHFTAFVRAGGPLPALRVGRQPYGVLPVTSIALWATAARESVPAETVDLLRQLHGLIGRFLPMSLRVGRGPDQDNVLMGLLRRSPESIAVREEAGGSGAGVYEFADWGSSFQNIPDLASSTWKFLESFVAYLQSITSIDELNKLDLTKNPPPGGAAPAALAEIDGTKPYGLLWTLAVEWSLFMWLGSLVALPAARKAELDPANAAPGQATLTDLWAQWQAELGATLGPGGLWDRAVQAASVDQGSLERQMSSLSEALSFRVDAWATSLATARVHTMRATAPTGIRIGAYGWLVDVEPIAPGIQKAEAGWVLTPSMQHAATAAVLHSGWAAHSAPEAFAVDLTSERVRRAQATLSALREGRTLEELLGYQLERSLHDKQQDELISALRQAFPLPVADPDNSDNPVDVMAARAEHGSRLVADGDAARHSGANFSGIPNLSADQKSLLQSNSALLESLFAQLDDTVDAMGDILLAESVHQLVGGSPLRAGLTADTVGRANPVPEHLDVLTTPRDHVAVTHTVAIAIAYPDTPPQAKPSRAQLDPAANTLASWALGDLDTWNVIVTSPAGTTDVSDLSDLDVTAIDVVVETTEPVDQSALAARIRQQRNVNGTVQITRHDDLGGQAALSTLVTTIRTLLAQGRPAVPGSDPLGPLTAELAVDIPGLIARIQSWWASVNEALGQWPSGSDHDQAAAIQELAGIGLVGVRFDSPPSVGAVLQERWGKATLAPDPPAEGVEVASWLAGVRDRVRSAAGEWFLGAASWTAADGGWAALAGEEPGGPVGVYEVEDWLEERRDVCAGVTQLTDALLATGAVGAGIPDWIVRQRQPPSPEAPLTGWVARQHPGSRSAGHLAALRVGSPEGTAHALLAVDQWVETVPKASRADAAVPDQTTGLGFRFDRPDARAPQALLLVAPPDLDRGWCMEDLHAAVDETLWWTRARPLDEDDLPEVSEVLST